MKMHIPRSWTVLAVACAGIAAILSAGGSAQAQEGPVIIGGSGLPPVEVHLEVLDQLERASPPEQPRERDLATNLPLPPLSKPSAPPPAPLPQVKPALAATTDPVPAGPSQPATQPPPKALEQPPAAPPVSAAPLPAPEEAPSVTEKKTETAALVSPAEPSGAGRVLRITFGPDEAELPQEARAHLQSLAAQLEADERARLQLRAYAGGNIETASQARRLSLSRALAVRSYLIEQGVRSTRVDVRALGIPEDEGPADRVDIVLLKP